MEGEGMNERRRGFLAGLRRLLFEVYLPSVVAAVVLALLLVVVQCGMTPALAQAAQSSGATTLKWDVYDVVAQEVDEYRMYYWLPPAGPSETFVTLPVTVNMGGRWHAFPDPEPCCLTAPPTCACGYIEWFGWWPQAMSPVKEVVGTAAVEGTEVCFHLTARRSATAEESGPSNVVCLLWPKVCEFSTQEELLACMGVVP